MLEYPFDEKTHHCFQVSWFKLFSEWLEYSSSKLRCCILFTLVTYLISQLGILD